MVQVLALGVALVGMAWWWYARARRRAARDAGRAARNHYHCVEVQAGSQACEAVREWGGKRFLSDEAPPLPVVGCRSALCGCRYVHYDDRRQDDRRNPYGQWANIPLTLVGERRSRTERRQPQEGTFRPMIAR